MHGNEYSKKTSPKEVSATETILISLVEHENLYNSRVFGGQVCNFAQTEKRNLRKKLQTVSETEEILFKKSSHVVCQ